jgi:hypothetical protein
MLLELEDVRQMRRLWEGRSLPRRVMAHWLCQGAATGVPQPRWFAQDPSAPSALMRLHGSDCMLLGPPLAVKSALRDVYEGRWESKALWPDHETEQRWLAAGRRTFQLSRVPLAVLNAARAVGFRDVPEGKQPSYSAHAWYVTGQPRFQDYVRHPCRTVTGEELLPLFEGSGEEDDIPYLKACLAGGPSFVCEIDGKPVCWSCTHLGGAMGRIYTPPEYRGRGYGKSLTAFQVEAMLHSTGMAVASVSINNPASYRMLQALGAKHLRGPMTWSALQWP